MTRSNWVDPTIKTGPTGMPRDPPVCLGPFFSPYTAFILVVISY
jgi:hypothetical protein